MTNSLVQKLLELHPDLLSTDGDVISVKVADLLGPTMLPDTAAELGDDLLMGLLYRLLEAVAVAEQGWSPSDGAKKTNGVTVIESTSLQQIAPGVRGIISQATIRVFQPVEVQQVEAIRF